MAEQTFRVQFLRGSTVLNDGYTGRAGEITMDNELWQIRVHDGILNTSNGNYEGTPGGHVILNKTDVENMIAAVNTRIDNLTKADVGLDQVDNTSDLDKPISTATQTALDTLFDFGSI